MWMYALIGNRWYLIHTIGRYCPKETKNEADSPARIGFNNGVLFYFSKAFLIEKGGKLIEFFIVFVVLAVEFAECHTHDINKR